MPTERDRADCVLCSIDRGKILAENDLAFGRLLPLRHERAVLGGKRVLNSYFLLLPTGGEQIGKGSKYRMIVLT